MPTIQDVQNELNNDPAGLGYKNPDGTFKRTKEILHLLTHRPVTGTTQKQVPDPPSFTELMSVVSPTSLANIPDETLVRVRELADAKDLAGLNAWLQVAVIKGYITTQEQTDIQNLLNRTKTVDEPVYGNPRIVDLGWGDSISVDLINLALGRPRSDY